MRFATAVPEPCLCPESTPHANESPDYAKNPVRANAKHMSPGSLFCKVEGRVVFALTSLWLMALPASAQKYPDKPFRVVTAPAGGGADFFARVVARDLNVAVGQQAVVDNRPTSLIAETVAHAAPDGYTLLVAGPNFWTGPLLRDMNYDPVRDFSPITWGVTSPNVLVVHPSLPVRSVKQLISLAKSWPGELNYAFGTIGSSSHLAAELFKSMAHIRMVGIPYKGAGPATNAVISVARRGNHSQLTGTGRA